MRGCCKKTHNAQAEIFKKSVPREQMTKAYLHLFDLETVGNYYTSISRSKTRWMYLH